MPVRSSTFPSSAWDGLASDDRSGGGRSSRDVWRPPDAVDHDQVSAEIIAIQDALLSGLFASTETMANVGTGVGVFRDKISDEFNLRSIKAGSSKITVSQSGSDEIHVDFGTVNFQDLFDVVLTSPADLDLLQFDSGTSKWVNRTLAAVGVGDMVLAGVQTVTGAKTFNDDKLLLRNPADTFSYTVSTGAIVAARTISLPVLTGNDTFVFEAHTQTLTNKTLTTPTISSTGFTNATHAHEAADSGGQLNATNVFNTGTVPTARLPAASDTVSGIAELATIAETSTGTDTGRTVTPRGLSQSVYGEKSVNVVIFGSDTAVTVDTGTIAFTVPASMNGMNLVDALASVHDQGVTGTTDVQVRRRRAGADVNMLSTVITIGAEFFASDGVINATNDDVTTGDQIYVDVPAIHSVTAPNGLSVVLTFRTP